MLSIAPSERFILASSSPRRQELLRSCGIEFTIEVSHVDEEVLPAETADALVRRLAPAKATVVSKRHPAAWVLGADTTVVVEGEILNKPVDAEDAVRMLGLLSGRKHTVWGGFALLCAERGICHVEVHRTVVEIRKLSVEECRAYVRTGEPMDKAGSYAIQDVGAGIVSQVEGSYTNVVGLNLSAVIEAGKQHKLFRLRNGES